MYYHMKPKTFQKSCNKISKRILGFECFNENDSYDLICLLDDALKSQETPSAFVRRVFAEDLSEIEYNKQLKWDSEHQ